MTMMKCPLAYHIHPGHEQTTSSAYIFSKINVWMGKYLKDKMFILTIRTIHVFLPSSFQNEKPKMSMSGINESIT
jgi:hypothetical protein